MIGDAVDRAADRVGDRMNEFTSGIMIKVVMGGLAVLGLVGVGVCLSMAAFWYLEPLMGAIPSLLVIAAAYLCLSLIFVAVMRSSGASAARITEAVEPVKVVEQEGREAVEEYGAVKFIAAAFAGGALLGGLIGGGRSDTTHGVQSVMSLLPAVVTAMTYLNADQHHPSHDAATDHV